MKKKDENKWAQINEEAKIIFENINEAIPEKCRAISVAIAVAQVLKSAAKQIKGSISKVEMRKFVLEVLDAIKDDEESTQSQI